MQKKFRLLLITVLMFFCCIGCSEKQELKPIENISDYILIRAADSPQCIKDALKELREAIKQISTAPPTLAVDTVAEAPYELLVGQTSRDGTVLPELTLGEFVIKEANGKIIITGGSEMAVVKGVEYFMSKYIDKDGVKVPTGKGIKISDEALYNKLEVNGKDFREYAISGKLYEKDKDERLSGFLAKLELATYCSLPIIDNARLSEYAGNYILLDDTNTDFSSYEIKVENGNIVLFANYYTLDDCIEAFFRDILGYDTSSGKIVGSREVNITEGRKYTVEKSAIYTKEKLYSVLEEVYNDPDKLIIGQQINQGVPIGEVFDQEVQSYIDGCGVEAAFYGWDAAGTLIYPGTTESSHVKLAYQMIEYMREGGIISFSTHFPNPADENPKAGTSVKGTLGDGDASEWDKLFTPDSDYHKRFMGYLEELADFLEIFRDNGAPIILRPLHEMNISATWWKMIYKNSEGKTQWVAEEYIKKLWIFIYDYLVNERGIDNMLWEYSPNVVERGRIYAGLDVMKCYPGDEYCDLVAVDWYPSQAQHDDPIHFVNAYEDMTTATGQIFSLGEYGPGDMRTVGDNYTYTTKELDGFITEVMDNRGVKLAYLLAWSSWGEGQNRVKMTMYEMGGGKDFYANNERYLDKSETKAMLYDD